MKFKCSKSPYDQSDLHDLTNGIYVELSKGEHPSLAVPVVGQIIGLKTTLVLLLFQYYITFN